MKNARQAKDWSLAKLAKEALGNEDRKGYCSEVEKGRRRISEGTILNFARALNLPASATDPLLGRTLPAMDETTATDATASALLKEAEAMRHKLKLSEALAVALAYKYAEGTPTDIEGALKSLEAALEVAAQAEARGALPSNYEAAVNDILARVDALNREGKVEQAYADLKAETARRKDAREAQVAQDERVLHALIAQAVLAHDPEGFAEAQLQRIDLGGPGGEDRFHRLRALWEEHYEDGVRFGRPFALTAAIGLAQTCIRIAPTPYLRAKAQNDLGLALWHQGARTAGSEGTDLLVQAVENFRAALRVQTEADHPLDWAMTMQSMAIALQEQGTRTAGAEGADLLAQAVEHYRAALRVQTEADHPLDWAMTMQNMANALQQQGTRKAGAEGADLLAQAVEHYRAALRVQTEADHPLDWAMTMQNMANALQQQGIRTVGTEGADLLAQALDQYRTVLRVITEANHPINWAITQENLAHAELARATHDSTEVPKPHLDAALFQVTNALRIYDPVHMSHNHGTATALRDDIQAALTSSSS